MEKMIENFIHISKEIQNIYQTSKLQQTSTIAVSNQIENLDKTSKNQNDLAQDSFNNSKALLLQAQNLNQTIGSFNVKN